MLHGPHCRPPGMSRRLARVGTAARLASRGARLTRQRTCTRALRMHRSRRSMATRVSKRRGRSSFLRKSESGGRRAEGGRPPSVRRSDPRHLAVVEREARTVSTPCDGRHRRRIVERPTVESMLPTVAPVLAAVLSSVDTMGDDGGGARRRRRYGRPAGHDTGACCTSGAKRHLRSLPVLRRRRPRTTRRWLEWESARSRPATAPSGARPRRRCGPGVLPHEDTGDGAGLHRVGEVLYVLGREDLRDLCLGDMEFVEPVEVVDLETPRSCRSCPSPRSAGRAHGRCRHRRAPRFIRHLTGEVAVAGRELNHHVVDRAELVHRLSAR